MTNTTEIRNSFEFANINIKLREYEKACKEFDSVVETNRKEMDEDEFWAWYKENDKPEYPITSGQAKAFRLAYWCETPELIYDDFVWESEAHDFVTTLREMGAESIVITDQSTALMENMHWFQSEGLKLVGLCEVETGNEDWANGKPEVKMGVRFEF